MVAVETGANWSIAPAFVLIPSVLVILIFAAYVAHLLVAERALALVWQRIASGDIPRCVQGVPHGFRLGPLERRHVRPCLFARHAASRRTHANLQLPVCRRAS